MSQPTLGFGREITLLRRALLSTDAVGNDVRGEIATVISGVSVWPSRTTENDNAAETVTTDLMLLLPPGTDVAATDRVRVGTDMYTVQGQPAVWGRSPLSGSSAGVLLTLRRVTG